MIYTVQTISDKLKSYQDLHGKIMRMINSGELYPLTKGLYETDKTVPGYCFASAIYGPSYLSFEFVLSRCGLIPEAVYTYTSATFGKKKTKEYENYFGRFTYRDIPKTAYPLGVRIENYREYAFPIATPEKALCDKLYFSPPVSSVKQLKELLFSDLRIDEEEFDRLDKETLCQLCDCYRSRNMQNLKKMLVKRDE